MTGKLKFLGLVALLPAIAFYGCSRSGPDTRGATPQAEAEKNSDSRLDAPPAPAPPARAKDSLPVVQYAIEAVAVSPQQLFRDSTITAIAKTLPSELPQDVQLRYVFWLNAAVAQDSTADTLAHGAAKKNDLIYVDAVLVNDGRVLARKRSLMIKILNSSPRIENVDFPKINGPGRYTIKIHAMDADADPLSYALAGDALPEETAIDSTGAVQITLTNQSPENIVFWVVVKDKHDGEARQEIELNFTKKTVTE